MLSHCTTDNPVGWQFDNTYHQLPDSLYTLLSPMPVRNPKLVVCNQPFAQTLGLDLSHCSDDLLAQYFSGNRLPVGAALLAQAYAGHQFGYFTILGDGRAHLLGEHITPNGQRFDIQLKGSGPTAYARSGDGRAALGPMLREYIISEAMHALGIPTTRSLAVVTTGEPVYRDQVLPGAILTRVAASHLRIGTFQYLAAQNDHASLKQLVDYAIQRHDPGLTGTAHRYQDWLQAVIARQVTLVVEWLRVGFVHGVMNTDNMAISGETIDYGPCAFIDTYHPDTVFSAIDRDGRYAYGNQPAIAQWNLERLAEALLPLLADDRTSAIAIAQAGIQSFQTQFHAQWLAMMRRKLGLFGEEQQDIALIEDWLQWMQQYQTDYTQSFDDLVTGRRLSHSDYQQPEFQQWQQRWQQRRRRHAPSETSSIELMRRHNPVIIPRNHRVQAAPRCCRTTG